MLDGMNKIQKYQNVISSFSGTLSASLPSGIHLSNLCALIKKEFGFFWVGFYTRTSENVLTLGPYQGEVPCFTIQLDKGVCGLAAKSGITQIVNDVHSFPDYIACHPEPNSEIVAPGIVNGRCEFVLDIDHEEKGYFDDEDQKMLEEIVQIVISNQLA